jgi:hypothetical protein
MIIYCWHSPANRLIKIGSTVSAAGARVRMVEYSRIYGVTCDPQSLRAFPVAPDERKLRWRGGWPMRAHDGLKGMEVSVRVSVHSRLKLLSARDGHHPPARQAVPHMSEELLYLGPCSYRRAVDLVDAAIHAFEEPADNWSAFGRPLMQTAAGQS